MVRDRGRREIFTRRAMHEGRRPEGELAGIAGRDKGLGVAVEAVRQGRRQAHEQVVGMLAVYQWMDAIRRFSGLQQQGIAVLAHEGIRRQHGVQLDGVAIVDGMRSHDHHHALDEILVAAARAGLMVGDGAELAVGHDHPAMLGRDHSLHGPVFRGRIGRRHAGGRGRGLRGCIRVGHGHAGHVGHVGHGLSPGGAGRCAQHQKRRGGGRDSQRHG